MNAYGNETFGEPDRADPFWEAALVRFAASWAKDAAANDEPQATKPAALKGFSHPLLDLLAAA